MKKLLISIFLIFFWFIGFSCACLIFEDYGEGTRFEDIWNSCITLNNSDSLYYIFVSDFSPSCYFSNWNSDYFISQTAVFAFTWLTSYCCWEDAASIWDDFITYMLTYDCNDLWGGWVSASDISVFYDYWHSSTTVSCNWDNSIYINGMASVTNQTTFTPFFNISYVDEDNQNLIESYNKDMLYLENWQFKKTYTWDNQWILTVQNQWWSTPDIIFTWETLPVVVTWNSDNVFSNFGDNALSVLYWNIPWFITGWVILFLIFFIIRLFIPKNRR